MEALSSVELTEDKKDQNGKVVIVDVHGYRFMDSKQVIRTAKVVIGKFIQK